MTTTRLLQFGLGPILVYDALDRGRHDDMEAMSGSVGTVVLATLLVTQAVVGASLIMLAATRNLPSVSSALAATAYIVAVLVHNIAEIETNFSGDVMLRHMLLWLVAMPSRWATVGLVAQLALLYGVSLLCKSPDAYLFEAHAARSTLLSEHYGEPFSTSLQHYALALAFIPAIGPWLSRAAWLAEAASTCAACAAISGVEASWLAYPLAAPVPMLVVLGLACRLSFLPAITLVLHAVVHTAIGEPRAPAYAVRHGAWRERLAAGLLAASVAFLPIQLAASEWAAATPFCVSHRTGAACAWSSAASKGARQWLGLSNKWSMFSLSAEGSLMTGNQVTFVFGADDEASLPEQSLPLYEVNIETLAPRSEDPHLNFGRGLRGALQSFRWFYLQNTLQHLGTPEAYAFAARLACARAERLWRAGALPSRPVGIERFEVVHDLPRRRGTQSVRALLARQHVRAAVPTWLGYSSESGWWGAWPHTVVAIGVGVWDCQAGAPHEAQEGTFYFDEPATVATRDEPVTAAAAEAEAAGGGVKAAEAMDNGEIFLFHEKTTESAWRAANLQTHEADAVAVAKLVTSTGEIVMAADETDYMQRLAEMAAFPGATVLEVGFGMGISAAALTAAGAAVHLVVEPNRGVFNSSLEHAVRVASRVAFSPVLGFWREVTPLLGDASFDGVLYDAFPAVASVEFLREARRVLRPGGVLTFYWSLCDDFGRALQYGRECEPWELARADLRDAGWSEEELGGEPETLILSIEEARVDDLTLGEGGGDLEEDRQHCPREAFRPRTFAVPRIVRSGGGGGGGGRDSGSGDGGTAEDAPAASRLAEGRRLAPLLTTRQIHSRADWQAMAINDDADVLRMRGDGAVVMDSEETENMRDLARIVAAAHDEPALRNGRALEVGYGLGIFAHALQAEGITEHIILEANIHVARRLLSSPLGTTVGVRPLVGFWQEVCPLMRNESFDSVFFDPFPNDEHQLEEEVVHQRAFMSCAYRLLKPGGIFSYMSGSCSADAITADRAAAVAAGFAPADVHIEVKNYRMRDHLVSNDLSFEGHGVWQTAHTSMIPLLVTRLVRR